MADFGLTDAGLSLPRTQDLLDRIQSSYRLELGDPTLVLEGDLLLSLFAGIVAELVDAGGQTLGGVYDALDENNATGLQLYNLARLTGTTPKRATKSRIVLRLTGTPGGSVGAGFIGQGGGPSGLTRWILLEDVALDLVTGIGTGTAEAEEAGALTAEPGDVSVIVTPTPGVTAVTNEARADPGQDDEAPDALRARRGRSIQAAGAHTLGATVAAVLAVPAVDEALLLDNADNAATTLLGISIPAHSYLLVVLPAPLSTADEDRLVDVLFDSLHIGLQAAGTDVERTRTDPNGTAAELRIAFDYGELVTVSVTASADLEGVARADVEAELQRRVDVLLSTLTLGSPLRLLALCGEANKIDGVIGATFTINGIAEDWIPTAKQRISAAAVAVLG